MIATTRIPTHRNDGSMISDEERTAILNRVREEFDGYTLEGPSLGAWVAVDGEVFEEHSYKLEVVVSAERAAEAQAHFMMIGRQLGQRAIFFEIREGGMIIELD